MIGTPPRWCANAITFETGRPILDFLFTHFFGELVDPGLDFVFVFEVLRVVAQDDPIGVLLDGRPTALVPKL